MDNKQLKNVVEAALLAAGRPLSINQLAGLLGSDAEAHPKKEIREVIKELQEEYEDRGICLVEVASGFRVQARSSMAQWLDKLWEERAPRYSRALLETLAILAYRQPITRGDIEDIRGVTVSTNIMRTLLERGWVKVVGQRDVPGKPALYATTKEFLDYFGLKKLDDLPPLSELEEAENLKVQLEIQGQQPAVDGETPVAETDEAEAGSDESAEALPVELTDGDSEADADADAAEFAEGEEVVSVGAEVDSDADDDADDETVVPHGGPRPLIKAPESELDGPATVTDLDSVREETNSVVADTAEVSETGEAESATVIPLKTS